MVRVLTSKKRIWVFFLVIILIQLSLAFLGMAETKEVCFIRLRVEESYSDDVEDVAMPYRETAKKILAEYGFQTAETFEESDATIEIIGQGEPKKGKYTGGVQFSGAVVSGEVRVILGEKVLYHQSFRGEVQPAERLVKKCKKPKDAPFDKAFKASGYQLSIHAAAYMLGAKHAFEKIAAALNSRYTEERVAAAEVLGSIREPRSIKPLLSSLSDKHSSVRMNVVKALGLLGNPRATEPLIKALKDRDKDVQKAAATALGDLRDPRAVEPLIEVLRKNLYVQSSAVEALGKIGTPAVEPIMSLFKEEALEALVRERLVETMGKIRDERTVDALLVLLRNEDPWLRRKAETAITDLGEMGVPKLRDLLWERKTPIETRLTVIDILGAIPGPMAERALLDALRDFDPIIRTEAAKALGAFHSPEVVRGLQETAKNDAFDEVRTAAGSSLERIMMTIDVSCGRENEA